MSFDLVIRDGWIVDGMSPSIFKGSIGIEEDKIGCIRPGVAYLPGRRIIDASDYCVVPGFVNIHSHADHFLCVDSPASAKAKLMQGITTEIGGNCGSSAYPWNDSHPFYLSDMKERFAWDSFADFLLAVEEAGTAVNFGSQIGLDSLRRGAKDQAGSTKGSSPKEALRLFEQALEEGAMGLSIGKSSHPELQAGRRQVIELARIVANEGGVLSADLYSEAGSMLDALTDLASIAVKTGAAAQVSHFKTLDRFNWSRQDVALELLERLRSRGTEISIDCFPYTYCCSPLGVFLPPHLAASAVGRPARSFGPRQHEAIEEYLTLHFPEPELYRKVVCPSLESPEFREFRNLDVLTMAAVLDRRPSSLFVELMAAEGLDRFVYYECISDDNMTTAIEMDCAMMASDPFPTADPAYFKNSIIHPRTFGAFQQYLSEFVYKNHIFDLPEAIKKITSAPARKFGLRGRGILGEGGFADIAIFDPENVKPGATVANPLGEPSGMEYVIVNGQIALKGGKLQNARAGKVLRR